jgi:protein-S-isoprenylcysteine O-methyltransferase Ste14
MCKVVTPLSALVCLIFLVGIIVIETFPDWEKTRCETVVRMNNKTRHEESWGRKLGSLQEMYFLCECKTPSPVTCWIKETRITEISLNERSNFSTPVWAIVVTVVTGLVALVGTCWIKRTE